MSEFSTTSKRLYMPSSAELLALLEAQGIDGDDTLTPLPGGHHNHVLRYGSVVVRYPKDASTVDAMREEYDLLRTLGGGRTPRVIDYADINGTPVALIEFIEGKHKDFNALTDEETDTLASAMYDLHTRTSDRFSPLAGSQPTVLGTHKDYIEAMVQESVMDKITQLEAAGIDLVFYDEAYHAIGAGLRRLAMLLAEHPNDFNGETFSLLHHDINPENIIWKPDGSITFIDLNPTYGDPLDDVNYAVVNNNGSAAFEQTFLTAYGNASGQAVSSVRMDAYTMKNRLDDLVWAMEMRERHAEYDEIYATRLIALQEAFASRQLK